VSTIAHIEDRGHVQKDGVKTRTARYGAGKRWRVRYLDPDGREHSESFSRQEDVKGFLTATAAKVQDRSWTDPDAGRVTLREFARSWLEMQTSGPTTREAVALRWRVQIEPVLGSRRLAELAQRPSIVQAWLAGVAGSAGDEAAGIHHAVLHPGRGCGRPADPGQPVPGGKRQGTEYGPAQGGAMGRRAGERGPCCAPRALPGTGRHRCRHRRAPG
jgi:hypothetical protein